MEPPIRWTRGAVELWKIIHAAADRTPEGTHAPAADVLLDAAFATLPDQLLTGRLLRDPSIWPAGPEHLRQVRNNQHVHLKERLGGYNVVVWELEAEKRARDDRTWLVGERHLMAQFPVNDLTNAQVKRETLLTQLAILELGTVASIDPGAWHALLDTSSLIEYQRPDNVDWKVVAGRSDVVLWVVGTVLDELDEARGHRLRRVRDRAKERSGWLFESLGDAISNQGRRLRNGVTLRVWNQSEPAGHYDSDHLDALRALRALGVEAILVTADLGMASRAMSIGLRTIQLPDEYRLHEEATAAKLDAG
jgi:PIN domain